MREKDVAEKFKVCFEKYPIHVQRNTAQRGWSDRMMQLPCSQVVMVEYKLVEVNDNQTFRLSTFDADQAAWFAKWQRNGGLCFLFLGLVDRASKFLGYAMLTCRTWDCWIEVNRQSFRLDVLKFITKDYNTIRNWFETWRLKYPPVMSFDQLLAAE